MAQITYIANTSQSEKAQPAKPFSRILGSIGHQVTYILLSQLEEIAQIPQTAILGRIVIFNANKPSVVDVERVLSLLKERPWYNDCYFILILSPSREVTVQVDKNVFLLRATGGTPLLNLISGIDLFLSRGFEIPGGASTVERIVRSIEFPPEYHQSGITILSYFASILRQKHLSENVKVAIEQNGLVVRLVIEGPTGQRELIERTLETYALVVTGKSPIDELTTDPLEAMELRSQLRTAYTQLQNQRDLLEFSKSEITHLRSGLEESKTALIKVQARSHSEADRFMSLLGGLISHNADLSSSFRRLAEEAATRQNTVLVEALKKLHKLIDRGLSEEDEEEFIQEAQLLRQQDPGVFKQVYDLLVKGAISGAAGNFLYSWLRAVIDGLPK